MVGLADLRLEEIPTQTAADMQGISHAKHRIRTSRYVYAIEGP
jgi:hypothetical protein